MTIIDELEQQDEQEFISKNTRRKQQLRQAHDTYVKKHKEELQKYMREYMRNYRIAIKGELK